MNIYQVDNEKGPTFSRPGNSPEQTVIAYMRKKQKKNVCMAMYN